MRKLRKPPPNFPYADPRVPIYGYVDGEYYYAGTVEEKLKLLMAINDSPRVTGAASVIACWPGKKRSDVFRLSVETALKALLPHAPQPTAPYTPQPPAAFPGSSPPMTVTGTQTGRITPQQPPAATPGTAVSPPLPVQEINPPILPTQETR